MKRKTLMLSLAAAAAAFFAGCGAGTSSTDTPTVTPAEAVLTVERGPLLDANVTDANGSRAHELGEGRYAFDGTPQYPVTAEGGYIDVNRNGQIDPGEVRNTLKLKAQSGDVVTIATTLAADKNVSQLLEAAFDLKPETVETKTPGQDRAVEALSDVVYAYAVEHNVTDISDVDPETVRALAQEYRQTVQQYREDNRSAAEHEEALMQRLSVPQLDDADAQEAQQKLQKKLEQEQGAHTSGQGSTEHDGNPDTEGMQSSVSSMISQHQGSEEYSSGAMSSMGMQGDAEHDGNPDTEGMQSSVSSMISQYQGGESHSSEAGGQGEHGRSDSEGMKSSISSSSAMTQF